MLAVRVHPRCPHASTVTNEALSLSLGEPFSTAESPTVKRAQKL